MRNLLIRLIVNAVALTAAARWVDGVDLSGEVVDVLLVALVFGLVNALIKPLLLFLSLPAIFLTLGLFAFVVNGMMLLITARLTDHLSVAGLWPAIIGSVVVSLVSALLGALLRDETKKRRRSRQ